MRESVLFPIRLRCGGVWILIFLLQENEEEERKNNKKNQLAVVSGLFFQPPPSPAFPPPSSSPTSLHTRFLAPGIRTGRSAVPSLAAPSHVSTPHAFPVSRSFGDDAAAAAEGEALETDQKHFSASLHVARAIFTEEAPAP